MRRWDRYRALVILALFASGCSDDATQTDSDASDTGGDVTPDQPTGPQTSTLVFHEPNEEGTCCGDILEGVHVALDRLSGRTEVTVGEDGVVEVTLEPDETVDITSALEGYIIVTNLGLTYDFVAANAAEPVDVFMAPIAPAPPTVTLTVTANGVPSGGSFCASPGNLLYNCVNEGQSLRLDLAPTAETVRLTGTAWGLSGALVDFADVDVTALTGDMSATFEFDGELAEDVNELRFRVDLPANEDSPLRQSLFRGAHLPVIVYDPADLTHYGATGNIVAATDDAWLLTTARWVALPDVEPLFLVFGLTSDGNYRSFRYFEERPVADAFYELLDVPVVVSHADGGNLGDAFTWTEVPGAQAYRMALSRLDTGATLWSVTTPTPSVDLPELPTGYDPAADWPADGAQASIFVAAFDDQDADIAADLEQPLRRDLRVSQSLSTPFTWSGF